MPFAQPEGVFTIGEPEFDVVTVPLNVAPQTVSVSLDRIGPARTSVVANWMVEQLELRAGVDQIDRELVALLARRFAYMDAAARIKPERGHVRDEARKAEVIGNARVAAEAAGLPGETIADLWERLVEASIAYELAAFDRH